MTAHVRCRGLVRGSTLRSPFEVIGRLTHSARLDRWQKGVLYEQILAAFDAARPAYEERTQPLAGRPEWPADVHERADVGTVELTDEQHALLVDLIDHAGERLAFAHAASARFAGLECVEFAPLLRDLATRLDAPLAAPDVPPLPSPPPPPPEAASEAPGPEAAP